MDIAREERMIPSAARLALSPEVEAAAAVKAAAAAAERRSEARPLEGNLNRKRSTRIDTNKICYCYNGVQQETSPGEHRAPEGRCV